MSTGSLLPIPTSPRALRPGSRSPARSSGEVTIETTTSVERSWSSHDGACDQGIIVKRGGGRGDWSGRPPPLVLVLANHSRRPHEVVNPLCYRGSNRLYTTLTSRITIQDVAIPVWFEQGACRGLGCEEFVKYPGTEDYALSLRQLCERCPVRQQCLQFALADPSICGLWGGTDDRERREIRKRRPASADKVGQ